MRELLIATTNPHKKEEIAHALSGIPFTVLNLKDVGLESLDVEETADTLEGNAVLKAKEYGARAGMLTLADDTGIFVDALDGRPGVISARYAPSPEARNQKLLDELRDIPDDKRNAQFKVVVALFDPESGKIQICEGELQGVILREGRGDRRFGYDPLFFIPELGKTYSELTIPEKDAISHRGKALRKVREILVAEFI